MKSKDLIQQELKASLATAFASTDENAIAQAFATFADNFQQNIVEEAKAFQATADMEILAQRGVRQLTAQETNFYKGIIAAASSANPQAAFTNMDTAYPLTVIDKVLEDVKSDHPLLAAIDFTNTTILTKIIVNKQGTQLAVWGPLNAAITAEMSGAIGVIDLTLCKLSAFMPLSKDMLLAGPAWVDAYVRGTLVEAIALGTETAVITGTGLNMPIGMDRDVSDDVSITAGVYPKKTEVAITDLDAATYGALLASLAVAPNGKSRVISKVALIVNPVDYFGKIFPATTVRAADGSFANNVFPFPTEVFQSPAVGSGKAIIGLAKKYFLGVGAGTAGGKIEYSDDFRFLDDQRVYKTVLHGNGRALDDNAFILLDISGLVATPLVVTVSGTVSTHEVV